MRLYIVITVYALTAVIIYTACEIVISLRAWNRERRFKNRRYIGR